MIEVEVKARAPADIARRVEAIGGVFQTQESHHDLYFNSESKNRDFRVSDEALRIRIKEEGARLTYKGPRLDSDTKSRLELTVRIDDAEQMQEILNHLGYTLSAQVRKVRRKYLHHGVILAIDEVDGLGCYIEAEAVGAKKAAGVAGTAEARRAANADECDCNFDYDEQKARVLSVMGRLGITEFIRSSYLELLEEKNGPAKKRNDGAL